MNTKKKICVIFGTRPDIIKLSPIIQELKKKKANFFLINSGQHFSNNMSSVFLKNFRINKIKYNLKIKKNKNSLQFIKSFYLKCISILLKEKPNVVIVQGDTNTCLVGALAAADIKKIYNIDIKIAHIEAGLRSEDFQMPEESNRIITDHISDILFPPTKIQKNNLFSENIKKNIFVYGSTIVDSLKKYNLIKNKKSKKYFMLTIHRYENIDKKIKLKKIFDCINKIANFFKVDILFFCHPNTLKKIKKFNIKTNFKIKFKRPVPYQVFLKYLYNSNLILSDSGGVQEEACILNKNLITLRNNTERPETLLVNSNYLSDNSYKNIKDRIKFLEKNPIKWSSPYGNNVSKKIVNKILFYAK
ncbi:WecB UDP-N-acetylglucosamine 2-epimerase [Candidatus Pelagibacterales bacterium]